MKDQTVGMELDRLLRVGVERVVRSVDDPLVLDRTEQGIEDVGVLSVVAGSEGRSVDRGRERLQVPESGIAHRRPNLPERVVGRLAERRPRERFEEAATEVECDQFVDIELGRPVGREADTPELLAVRTDLLDERKPSR